MDLVRWRTLRFRYRVFQVVTVVFLVTGCSLGVAILLVGDGLPMWLATPWFVVLGSTLGAVLLSILFILSAKTREAAAGYTTAFPGFEEVATVDPATGVVLREAGASLLTAEEFERRRAEHAD